MNRPTSSWVLLPAGRRPQPGPGYGPVHRYRLARLAPGPRTAVTAARIADVKRP